MFGLSYKPLVFARIVLISLCMLMAGLGVYGHQLTYRERPDYYINFWFFKQINGVVAETSKLGCHRLKQRMEAGAAFGIIAIVLWFSMWVISWYDMIIGPRLATKIIYHASQFLSWVFVLISWSIGVAFYHQYWCRGFVPKTEGLKIGYGCILLIVAWCLSFVHILLYVIADPAEGEFDDFETDTDSESENDEEMEKADDKNAPDHNAARIKEAAPTVDTVNGPDTAVVTTTTTEEEPAIQNATTSE